MGCLCEYRKRIHSSGVRYDQKKSVYLDNGATTEMDLRVLRLYEKACRETWANPSSAHSAGALASEALFDARRRFADYFSWSDPSGVRFCSSGSEALHGVLWGLLTPNPTRPVIYPVTEHAAVRHPLGIWGRMGGRVSPLGVDGSGRCDPDELRSMMNSLGPRGVLVLSPVNHETGSLQPLEKLAGTARREGWTVVLDGVQAAARMAPEEFVPFGEWVCVSVHKLYGPKGVGAVLGPAGPFRGFRFGGSQEQGLFPGTENIPGAVAAAGALELYGENPSEEFKNYEVLLQDGLRILDRREIEYRVQSPENRAPGMVCLSFPWVNDMDHFMTELNRRGICLSRFSACTDRIDGPSRILRAMGRGDGALTSVRLSVGRMNRRDDFFHLAAVLEDLQKRMR